MELARSRGCEGEGRETARGGLDAELLARVRGSAPSSGVSPASTLPPGNSHSPAIDLPCGRWAISTRPSTSTSATAATSTRGRPPSGGGPPGHSSSNAGLSRTIAAVDVDVAVRQVAGPHRRAAAADAEIDADRRCRGPSCARRPASRRSRATGPPSAICTPPIEIAELVAIGLLAGLADRHDDAAPIGVLAGDRRLDQRRIADREADACAPHRRRRRRRPRSSRTSAAPSPSRTICCARSISNSSSARESRRGPDRRRSSIGAMAGLRRSRPAAPCRWSRCRHRR